MQWGSRRDGAKGGQVSWSLSLPTNTWTVHLYSRHSKEHTYHNCTKATFSLIWCWIKPKCRYIFFFEVQRISKEVFRALKTPRSSERTSSWIFHLSENPISLLLLEYELCCSYWLFSHISVPPILQRVSQLASTHRTDHPLGLSKCLLIRHWHLQNCYKPTMQTPLVSLKIESRGHCETKGK